ncbi:poly-gamma-glutamate system protein [Candidatus Marinimicrobia bacterium]|nr:poly-gamma-glutamate system protein [Candidatus Neomarinimicrobiota bacterium]
MFRPSIQKTRVLFSIAILNIFLYIIVSATISTNKDKNYDLKVKVATKVSLALDLLKIEGRDFEYMDRDPFDTRLIFNRNSALLTDIGKYQAKVTALKPNFSALVIDFFSKAGLAEGDTVALSMTGSMPGANIAVLVACKEMGLEYTSISSLGASEWGATDMNLSWPKMEKILFENNLIKHTSNKFTYGGSGDYLKRGKESRQDYGGQIKRQKIDSLMKDLYPEESLKELFLVYNLHSNYPDKPIAINEALPINRNYYALPLSIARRLDTYSSKNILSYNKELFINAINSRSKKNKYNRGDTLYIAQIAKAEIISDNKIKKNKGGIVPEALNAILAACEDLGLFCMEPAEYESFIDCGFNESNVYICSDSLSLWDNRFGNQKYDFGERFNDINNNGRRDMNKAIYMNRKFRDEIKKNISQDYNLSKYKAYINIGGGISSFGFKGQEKLEKYFGYIDSEKVSSILPSSKERYRGVMGHFSDADIPIINIVEIEKLVREVDIKYFNKSISNKDMDILGDGLFNKSIDINCEYLYDSTEYNNDLICTYLNSNNNKKQTKNDKWNENFRRIETSSGYFIDMPDGMIDTGKGNLFVTKKHNLFIVWCSLIISLSITFYIGFISYRQITTRMRDYNPNE